MSLHPGDAVTTARGAVAGTSLMSGPDPRRVLVTGITGFIARQLVPEFLAAGWRVRGVHRRPLALPWLQVEQRLCDLTGDPADVRAAVHDGRPDLVIHLAAMIPPDRVAAVWSWTEANGRATEQLLAACRECEPPPRVVIVSSGAVYGSGDPGGPPFDEARLPAPATAYGVSKILVEALGVRAALAWGLAVVRARLFNVTGPGEPTHLAIGAFAHQLTAIALEQRPPTVTVGDLATTRDFLDVRDAARGLFLAATRGQAGEVYNICSGTATKIETVLGLLLDLSGLAGRVAVESRPIERDPVRWQQGDPRRLSALTGWRPTRALRDTLAEVLEDCRMRQTASVRADGA